MKRIDIIENPNFNKIHNFFCEFIQIVDIESMNILVENKFIQNLVKKELDLGLIYSKTKHLQRDYKTLFYNLEYTLVEEVEDHYGYRENDVTLNIVIDYYTDNTFIISRDIISKNGDIDYDKSERTNFISSDRINSIKGMKENFIKVLKDFIVSHWQDNN